MKFPTSLRVLSVVLIGSVLLASCSSNTLIQSDPSGARLYLNNEAVGRTPYTHTDTRIVGSTTTVKLEMVGYEPFYTTFSRDEAADVGAIIGGFFLLIPFLWALKYKPIHTYELTPLPGGEYTAPTDTTQLQETSTQSKADRLREFKELLDEGVITQEEFDTQKKKILEEGGNED